MLAGTTSIVLIEKAYAICIVKVLFVQIPKLKKDGFSHVGVNSQLVGKRLSVKPTLII